MMQVKEGKRHGYGVGECYIMTNLIIYMARVVSLGERCYIGMGM
jgi:hypothetical protein